MRDEQSYYFVLYRILPGLVVCSDCPGKLERQLRVREFLVQKVEGGQVLAGGSVGLLPALMTATRVASTPSCYYASVAPDLVLALIATSENLNLFLPDLQHFVEQVRVQGEAGCTPAVLATWQHAAIAYIARAVAALPIAELAVLLHGAVMGLRLHVSPPPLSTDLELLAEAVRLRPTLGEDAGEVRIVVEPLSVASRDSMAPRDSNAFCEQWARELKAAPSHPFALKQAVDEKKMEVMNALNVVNKQVMAARGDHYALYACYRYLRASANLDVLLVQLLKDASSAQGGSCPDAATLEVLQTVYDYHLAQEAEALAPR